MDERSPEMADVIEADVAIVGGGVIGCLTAIELRRAGLRPVVIERGEAGREASWAGAGILCPIQPWLYPDAFTRLAMASLAMWPDLARELEARTGIATQWRRTGLTIPFFAEDAAAERDEALAWSRRFGWRVEELDAAAARAREPVLAADVRQALCWPDVAQVRNPRLLRAVRARMRALEIPLCEGREVVAPVEADGRVAGVRLAGGGEVRAPHVLLAAGSWSGELARRFGVALPVEPVKGQIALLRASPGRVRGIIKHPSVYFVPRVDGRVLVGASMERVGFTRGTTAREIARLLAAMRRIAPGLADAPVEREWMGFRPGTPDGLPCLGPVRGRKGLWVASGHYRNGVLLAPASARLMAGWIADGRPPAPFSAADMPCFDPLRVFDEDARIGFPQQPAVAGHAGETGG